MLWALRGVTQRHQRGEWTLFIWPQPEHFAVLALATAAPVRALQAGGPFREERPFPRFVRQRGNENLAVQGEQRPPPARRPGPRLSRDRSNIKAPSCRLSAIRGSAYGIVCIRLLAPNCCRQEYIGAYKSFLSCLLSQAQELGCVRQADQCPPLVHYRATQRKLAPASHLPRLPKPEKSSFPRRRRCPRRHLWPSLSPPPASALALGFSPEPPLGGFGQALSGS